MLIGLLGFTTGATVVAQDVTSTLETNTIILNTRHSLLAERPNLARKAARWIDVAASAFADDKICLLCT